LSKWLTRFTSFYITLFVSKIKFINNCFKLIYKNMIDIKILHFFTLLYFTFSTFLIIKICRIRSLPANRLFILTASTPPARFFLVLFGKLPNGNQLNPALKNAMRRGFQSAVPRGFNLKVKL